MTSDLHARAREIFLAALERSGPEREEYLDGACAGDDELRRAVASLLDHHDRPTESGHPAPRPASGRSGQGSHSGDRKKQT